MQQKSAQIAQSDLSTKVLESLATEMGCSPLDFETPLYDVIDPDALNALFAGGSQNGHVEFTYNNYRIVADATGDVRVSRDN